MAESEKLDNLRKKFEELQIDFNRLSENQSLQRCLDKLDYLNSKDRRNVIETLFTIYRNLAKDPGNEKYRRINLSNRTFMEKVWLFRGAQEFMMTTGWQKDGSFLVYKNNNIDLDNAIDVLLKNRIVIPSTNEWVAETKHEGQSDEQKREEELRRKAVQEREKELEEYMKEKRYREKLSNDIKAQIRADKEKRRLMSNRATTQLKNNARIKTLSNK